MLLVHPASSPAVKPLERVGHSGKDQVSGFRVDPLAARRSERDAGLHSLTAEGMAALTGYDFMLSALKKAWLAA